MKKIKLLTLYSLPFIAALLMHGFDIKVLTQITGNTSYSFWITGIILVYYLIVITLTNTFKTSLVAILAMLILSIAFLPVRKDISTIDYLTQGDKIYWIERYFMSGEIVMFSGDMQPLIKPMQVHIINEVTHSAHLELDDSGVVLLVYSEGTSPEKYQKFALVKN